MRIFEKLTKQTKEISLVSSYADYVIDDYNTILNKINKFKEVTETLSHSRRKDQAKERENLAEHLFRILTYIDNNLDFYFYDLIDLIKFLENHPELILNKKTNQHIDFALRTKGLIKKEYETIYHNFKNMAKKLDNIPMKEMLKKMSEVFEREENSRKLKPRKQCKICYPSW